MAKNVLSAGVARIDITPQLRLRMQGALRRVEGADGIDSNLLATALALADNDSKIVIVDCDLIGFDRPLPEEVRQKIGAKVGTAATDVLLGATRALDGAANPYLAAAAMLAAGLDGIDNQIDPGTRNDDNLYVTPEDELVERGIGFLPTTLAEALDHLEQDEVVKAALGPEYAPYYIEVKRDEWNRYNRSVSQWETDNYLALY